MKTRVLTLSLFALLSAAPVAAQEKGEDLLPSPVLSKSVRTKLNKLLASWYKTDVEVNSIKNEITQLRASGGKAGKIRSLRKKSSKLRRSARKAKSKFRDAFKKEGEKAGDLLKHVGDLVEIFDGCFPYPKQANGGIVKTINVDKKAGIAYSVRYPKKYKPNKSWPLIYSLQARSGNKWTAPKAHIEAAWPKDEAKSFAEAIVISPKLPDDMDLSEKVDPINVGMAAAQKAQVDKLEDARRMFFLQVFSHTFNTFRIDTDRVYLEANAESIPFALRLASQFPDRFAGLILKEPATAELDASTMLGNLSGVGVAIVGSGAACQALEKAFKDAGNKTVTVIKAQGKSPFADKAGELMTWIDQTKRKLYRRDFTLTPGNDRFRKAYWVSIEKAEYLTQVPMKERPQVTVKVDRDKNRVEIKGRNVSKVRLLLNDILLDLDKEVTIVLNGQVRQVKRARSLPLLADTKEGLVIRRNDPRFIFTSSAVYDLPSAEGEGQGPK